MNDTRRQTTTGTCAAWAQGL